MAATLWVGDSPGGNYIGKLKDVVEQERPKYPPTAILVPHVQHDDWCAILRSVPAPCDCDPDIVLHGPGTYCDLGPCKALKED